MSLFPAIVLAETEIEVAHSHLLDPAVQKYFRFLAQDLITNIVTASPPPGDHHAEEFLRKVAKAQGSLEVLQTFLSIQSADS